MRRSPDTRPPTPRGRVASFQHLVGEVFRLNGQLLATAGELARPIGVSPAGWQTIAVLRDGGLPVADIARQLGLRRQSVQHNVNRLVAEGLATLADNPRHRRASLVVLTQRGKRTMARLHGLQARLTRQFLGRLRLTDRDLEALAEVLRTLRELGAGVAIAPPPTPPAPATPARTRPQRRGR
jgi:DNA-binding MarR family transcriptional regulator